MIFLDDDDYDSMITFLMMIMYLIGYLFMMYGNSILTIQYINDPKISFPDSFKDELDKYKTDMEIKNKRIVVINLILYYFFIPLVIIYYVYVVNKKRNIYKSNYLKNK